MNGPSSMISKKQEKKVSKKTKHQKEKALDLNKPEEEKGGYKDAGLLEPTRYGPNDWDVKGRCSDF